MIFGWRVSFLWAGQNVTKFFLLIFKVSIFAISWMIWNASFFKSKTNKVKQSLSSTTASLLIRTRKAFVAFKINQQNKRSNVKRPWSLLLSIPKVYLLIEGLKYCIELTFWKMYTQESFKQMNWLCFGVPMIIYIYSHKVKNRMLLMGIIHNLLNMYLLDTNAEVNRLQMPVSGKTWKRLDSRNSDGSNVIITGPLSRHQNLFGQ